MKRIEVVRSMEVSPKNLFEQYSCQIQEIRGTSEKVKPSIGEVPKSRDVTESARYPPRRDLMSNSTSSFGHIREETLDGRTEVILLRQELAKDWRETITANRQIIELSDNDGKLALRRQLEMTNAERGRANARADASTTSSHQNAEILRKLPPGTIVIRQEARTSREDNSDYSRELTETNSSSGGSSSTSGCASVKVKRIPRAVRNKTHETVEVRRNPMRVSKRDIDKDFPRPRQRLLANSKRETCSNYESGKRIRASAKPYMNTRSVTRKMYTVGATYQAPTKKDEIEWKQWPVHGMHERPVYHPQAGLAVEYLGRYFTSLDGLSYCEIIDEPGIEVVAVDPRYDQRSSSVEKKGGKTKAKSKRSSNGKNTWSNYLLMENKSFKTCMHGSLHCVLGYCSQVMAPSYKQAVDEKTTAKLTVPAVRTSTSGSAKETTMSCKVNPTNFSENFDQHAEEAKLLEGYTIAMAQSVQNKSTGNKASGRRVSTATIASSSATYVPETQRSIVEVDVSKNISQCGMAKMPTLRGFPNASLVFLKNADTKTSGELCKAKDARSTFNQVQMKDTSTSEEMLSICKKLVSANELPSNRERSPAIDTFYTLKRQAANVREYSAKKITLEGQLANTRPVQVTKGTDESGNTDGIKIKGLDASIHGGMFVASSSRNRRTWCTTETSEIARILSEYNRSTTRKSAIEVYGSASRNMKANIASSSAKNLAKTTFLWPKDTTGQENRKVPIDKNVGLDLSQGKWKKLLTLEEIKKAQITDSEQNAWNESSVSSEKRQSLSKDRQVKNVSTLNRREKPAAIRKDLSKQREITTVDAKSKEATSECSKDETEISKTKNSLQELLEDTAVLYCAANGVHQDDLSNYIDTLDSRQSIQWLENWNNSIV